VSLLVTSNAGKVISATRYFPTGASILANTVISGYNVAVGATDKIWSCMDHCTVVYIKHTFVIYENVKTEVTC